MYKNLTPGAIGIKCGWIEGLDLAKEAGFQGADLSLGDAQRLAAEQGTEAVKALYAERGLQIGGWSFPDELARLGRGVLRVAGAAPGPGEAGGGGGVLPDDDVGASVQR
jgi:hypothetical protein